MNDSMHPLAQRLIEQTRAARTPSQEDKDRVRKALLLGLGAGAVSIPAVAGGAKAMATATAATAPAAGTAGAVGVSLGAKLVMAVALVASVGGGGYWLSQRSAPPARSAVVAPAPAAVVAPTVELIAAPPAVAPTAPPAVEAPAPALSPRDPMLAELSLLHRAQQAWRQGHATQALDLAQQHARRYPRSTLKLERDALRLFALCSLGRKAQARPLAQDLLKRAADSPLRASVEESCGMR